jgi:hypothetical protein
VEPVGDLDRGLLVGGLGVRAGSAGEPAVAQVGVQDVRVAVEAVLVGAAQPASVAQADTFVTWRSADDQAVDAASGLASPAACASRRGDAWCGTVAHVAQRGQGVDQRLGGAPGEDDEPVDGLRGPSVGFVSVAAPSSGQAEQGPKVRGLSRLASANRLR